MFKNMKLGTKITAGFAVLILIAVSLGSLAVWNMLTVRTAVSELAQQRMPEVAIGNQLERSSLQTMFQMRGYAFTEEAGFLTKARETLASAKKALTDAKEHATKCSDAVLTARADKAGAKVQEYEQMAEETVSRTEALDKDRAAMDAAGQAYMKACSDFLDGQNKMVDEDFAAAAGAADATSAIAVSQAKLKERLAKINIATDLVDLGNAVRLGNWRAQANRDAKLFRKRKRSSKRSTRSWPTSKPSPAWKSTSARSTNAELAARHTTTP